MKSPAGRNRPAAKKPVRLDLRRAAPPPPPEDEMAPQRSHFWMWFGLVAAFHVALLIFVMLFYRPKEEAPPTPPFFSLMPQGDTVKGTPGAQAAPKVGASTPAPSHPHHPKPRPITPPIQAVTPPPAVQPPPPKIQPKVQPKPVIKDDTAPPVVAVKPKPAKPAPPKPKIKVDLHLSDAPTSDQPAPKPAKHVKKTPPPVAQDHPDDSQTESSNPDTMGLSKDQIAAKLGQKMQAEGVTHADRTGKSGVADGSENRFGDFYNSIREQITNKWEVPNQNDPNAVDPVVQIHVDKDGRVPASSVVLLKSSGNSSIDESALSAARAMGYTLQPLPDGCPPDISISLQLAH